MRPPRTAVADAALGGVVLFAAAAAWTVTTGAIARSSPWPMAGLIVAAGLTIAVAWMVSLRWRILVPAAVVVGTVVVSLADARATFDLDEYRGPLGYANSSGALFGLAVVAALLVAVSTRSRSLRIAGVAMAVAFTPLVLLARVWAVAILLPGLVLAALLATRLRGARAAVVVCAAVFALALLGSVVLGAARVGTGAGPVGQVVGGTLSEARIQLWNEALSIAADDPLVGVGPGRFDEVSPTASDPDLRYAHQEFLQAAAETGLLGFLLSVGVFLWAFAALHATANGAVSALGAAALALLGAHASVDYVLHFPAVTLAGAAILGAALAADRRREPLEDPIVVSEPARELV
jgi:O-antigen ligase